MCTLCSVLPFSGCFAGCEHRCEHNGCSLLPTTIKQYMPHVARHQMHPVRCCLRAALGGNLLWVGAQRVHVQRPACTTVQLGACCPVNQKWGYPCAGGSPEAAGCSSRAKQQYSPTAKKPGEGMICQSNAPCFCACLFTAWPCVDQRQLPYGTQLCQQSQPAMMIRVLFNSRTLSDPGNVW